MCSFKELIENNPPLEEKEITIGKLTFKVKSYLPIEDRIQIAELAAQEAWEDNCVNDIKVEAYVDIFSIMYYTNIEFTDEEKANPIKIYNELKSTGLFDKIIATLPQDYWRDTYDYIQSLIKVKTGIIGFLNRIAEQLPAYIEQLQNELKNISPELLDKINSQVKSE